MASVTWPSMPSFEEANERLSGLLAAERQKKAADLRALEHHITRTWDDAMSDEPDEASPPRREAPRRVAGTGRPPEEPFFVPLPRRTSHGGPWGPAMVAKFRRIAAKGSL